MPTGTPQDPYHPPPKTLVYFASHDVLFVHCATCGAGLGVYCTRRGGSRDINRYLTRRWDQQVFRFHPARQEVVGLSYCGRCRAAPGEYCITAAGKPTAPHKARRRWRAEVVGSPRVYAPYWPGLMSVMKVRREPTRPAVGLVVRIRHWGSVIRRLVLGPIGRS